jgi:uncharacterized membrane protein
MNHDDRILAAVIGGGIFIAFALVAIETGQTRFSPFGIVERRYSPILFWAIVVLYAAAGVLFALGMLFGE